MFNLKELQSARGKLDQHRQTRSDQGISLDAESPDQPKTSTHKPGKEFLIQTMIQFVERTCQQHKRVEPLAVLAYIYSRKSPSLAQKYYLLALDIDPDSVLLRRLQNILDTQDKQSDVAESKLQPDSEAEHDVDSDGLYDLAEALIDSERRQILKRPLAQELILESSQLQLAEQVQASLSKALKEIQAILIQIQDDYDIQDLQARLQPLEVRLWQVTRLIGHSRQAQKICRETAALVRIVTTELNRKPLSAAKYDRILDAFDKIADQLDELERQQVSIAEPKKQYKQLYQLIITFQEQLEDAGL